MNELDEVWAQKLNEAVLKAQASGSGDVAEYLALKAANDMIRSTSVKWLFDSATEIAAAANRMGLNITMENESPYGFTFQKANLVGTQINFRSGVRNLSIEAGWTRTPADGFMRGGALAGARISHFGIGKANDELLLIQNGGLPMWFSVDKEGRRAAFDSNDLQRHFRIFLGAA
jgi:hypothetical protein